MSDELSYNTPLNQYGGSIVLLTNPENELFKLELTFRSAKQTDDGKIIQIGEPLMNEKGINSIIGIVQSIVSQVTIMSNLNRKEIDALRDFLADTLAKDLMINAKYYEIKSATARDKIFHNAISMSYITMKRAYEEGDKRFWKGSVQEIHQTNDSNRGNGIFSAFNPWGKQ